MYVCKCDICGKEIRHWHGRISYKDVETETTTNGGELLDLCKECYDNVIPHIKSTIKLAKKGLGEM